MHFLLSSLSSAKKRSDGSKRGWKTIQNQYGLLRWWQKSKREDNANFSHGMGTKENLGDLNG